MARLLNWASKKPDSGQRFSKGFFIYIKPFFVPFFNLRPNFTGLVGF